MKSLLLCLGILCLLSLHSCKKSTDQDATPPVPKVSSPYRYYKVNTKKSTLGFAVIDTLRREVAYAFGKKNASGTLLAISNLFYYSSKSQLILKAKVSDDYLLTEINIISKNNNKILRFDGYDLAGGKVNAELIDQNTNAVIVSKRQLTLSTNLVATIKAFQQASITSVNGGRVADLCLTQANMIHLSLSYMSCILSISTTTIAFASGIGALTGALNIAGTLLSCLETLQDFKEFFDGKCAETNLDDGLQTSVGCILSFFTMTSYFDLLDCITSLADDITGFLFPPDPNREKEDASGGRDGNGSSTGDPHLTTTDNVAYDFQAHGEFIVVKSTKDNFEVQVRQEDVNNNGSATLNTAIAVQTGTDVVCVTAEKDWLFINGKAQDLNFDRLRLADDAYILRTVDKNLYTLDIVTKNGDVVRVRFHNSYLLDYILYLKDNRRGAVTGLLGNYDGDMSNDLRIRNGAQITNTFSQLYPTFANSWRIQQSQSLLYYPSGKTTASYTKLDFPKAPPVMSLDAVRAARELCLNAGVNTEPFLSNCIFDVTVTNDKDLINSSVWSQTGDPVSNTYGKKFAITDFSNLPVSFDATYNTKIVGATAEMAYNTANSQAKLGMSLPYNLANGFESTFEFAGTTDMVFQVSLATDQFYNPLGIGALNGNTVIQGTVATSTLIDKKIPSLFDGKRHKVKIIWRNISIGKGSEYLVYADDMNNPIYHSQNTNVLSLYEFLVVTSKYPNALRQISLLGFNNPPKDAKLTIYSWSFTPL